MLTKKKILPQHTTNEGNMSKLSKYFRILIKFCIIPLNIDFVKETLSFGFLTWKFGVFSSLSSFGPIAQWLVIGFVFGVTEYWNFFLEFTLTTNATDIISMSGFALMHMVFAICNILFIKNSGKVILPNFHIVKIYFSLVSISNEVTMAKNLSWPKYGNKLIFLTFLEFLALSSSSCMFNSKMAMDLELSTTKLLLSFTGVFLSFWLSVFFLTNTLLLLMTWIEEFGQICTKYTTMNIMSHVEKCLHMFNTLQNGLGSVLKRII